MTLVEILRACEEDMDSRIVLIAPASVQQHGRY